MKFDIEKTISYWLESAEYDLDTAESLFEKEKYPYTLFFWTSGNRKTPEEIKRKLAGFMQFYLEARYPEERKKFYKECTKDFAEQNLNEIKKVYKWLKERL